VAPNVLFEIRREPVAEAEQGKETDPESEAYSARLCARLSVKIACGRGGAA